jgi:hypothetical protein
MNQNNIFVISLQGDNESQEKFCQLNLGLEFQVFPAMHLIAPNDSNKNHNTNSSMAFSLHDNSHSTLARDMDDLLQANQNLKEYITSYPFVCHFASIGLYGHARIAISHL